MSEIDKPYSWPENRKPERYDYDLDSAYVAVMDRNIDIADLKALLAVKDKEITNSDAHIKQLERGIDKAIAENERLKEKQIKHGKKIDTWMRRAIAHQANSKDLQAKLSRYESAVKIDAVVNTQYDEDYQFVGLDKIQLTRTMIGKRVTVLILPQEDV